MKVDIHNHNNANGVQNNANAVSNNVVHFCLMIRTYSSITLGRTHGAYTWTMYLLKLFFLNIIISSQNHFLSAFIISSQNYFSLVFIISHKNHFSSAFKKTVDLNQFSKTNSNKHVHSMSMWWSPQRNPHNSTITIISLDIGSTSFKQNSQFKAHIVSQIMLPIYYPISSSHIVILSSHFIF